MDCMVERGEFEPRCHEGFEHAKTYSGTAAGAAWWSARLGASTDSLR
jgi:hypothetical protein